MDNNIENKYVKALANDDSKAFEWLFLNYQPKLIYFLSGFLHDEKISRDIAQDIFYNVWVNRTKISKVDSFKAYLFRIARNAVYNHYKHSDSVS